MMERDLLDVIERYKELAETNESATKGKHGNHQGKRRSRKGITADEESENPADRIWFTYTVNWKW